MSIIDFARTVAPNTQVILETKTKVKMNKKHRDTKEANPYQDVWKLSKVQVTLNASYEDRVNAERIAEGKEANFEAKEMKYGEMVGNALLQKDEQLYIKCIEEARIGQPVYVTDDGKEVAYLDLRPYFPASKPSEHQALENEVKARNFKAESIINFELV